MGGEKRIILGVRGLGLIISYIIWFCCMILGYWVYQHWRRGNGSLEPPECGAWGIGKDREGKAKWRGRESVLDLGLVCFGRTLRNFNYKDGTLLVMFCWVVCEVGIQGGFWILGALLGETWGAAGKGGDGATS
jgi:hypothetical protein